MVSAGLSGGGRGIRTPVTLSGKAVFKTACFNRSHIPPREQLVCSHHCTMTVRFSVPFTVALWFHNCFSMDPHRS